MTVAMIAAGAFCLAVFLVRGWRRSRQRISPPGNTRRAPLHLEPLSERVVPSVAALPLPGISPSSAGLFATYEIPLDATPVPQHPAVGGWFLATDCSPPCGGTIRSNGVEIQVFGSDASQVQLVLLGVAGLLLGQPLISERRRNTGCADGSWLSSQFRLRRLRERLPDFLGDLEVLDELLNTDVASSLNKARFIVEKALHQLCLRAAISWGSAEPTLERLKGPLVARGCVPKNIAIHLDTIQRNASPGSHYQESPLSSAHVMVALTALVAFLEWYADTLTP
jgi:hypothetical protein